VNGLLKFLLYSAILYGVDFLSAEFHYEPRWLPGLVALFLAIVGHFADRWVLPRTGDPLAVLLGGGFMVFTIWGASFLFPGSEVTRTRPCWPGFCWESRNTACTGLFLGYGK